MRLRYGSERVLQAAWPGPCWDCAALDGQPHMRGCCLEECAACGGQAMYGCGQPCWAGLGWLLYLPRALGWRWRLAHGAQREHVQPWTDDDDDGDDD